MIAYTQNDDGTLRQVGISLLDGDDRINIGSNYNPCSLTKTGTTTLMGWGTDDGEADVYTTDGGAEIIVPERIKAKIAQLT